jgi:hypothetical protein
MVLSESEHDGIGLALFYTARARSEFLQDSTEPCTPESSFLRSSTQVGGKFVAPGDALSQLLVFDCDTEEWMAPAERSGCKAICICI